MTAEKTRTEQIQIRKVRRTRTRIFIAWNKGNEEQTTKSSQNPRKSFHAALDALPPLICKICALPAAYVDKMTAVGLTIAGDGDEESVTLLAKKDLSDNAHPFNLVTPLRRLGAPAEPPEEGSPKTVPLDDEQLKLIDAVVREAKRYVLGDREQGELNLEGAPEPGPED